MNERIKQLVEQATTFDVVCGFDTTQYTEHFSKEKFAELIVRDCVMCMYRSGVEGFGILEERMLKEHFGVEE